MNDVVVSQQAVQTVPQLKAQIQLIQQAMRGVMKKDTHYGIIPGTQKPSLWKPGAEVLCTLFRIAVDPEVVDLSANGEIRYQVRARGVHQLSGTILGTGIGECSSAEDKYAWRAAVSEMEFDATLEDRRRFKFYKGGGTAQQVRTNPADVANTVLKMAKKRAQIDMVLTATAASDIFTQDLEDLHEAGIVDEVQQQPEQPPAPAAPQRKAGGQGKATPAQVKLLHARIDQSGVPENAFIRHFDIDSVAELPFGKVDDALQWLAGANG